MKIAFLFYEGMTALDVIGPHEILCHLPGAEVFRVAKQKGNVTTDSAGLVLHAEYSLSDVHEADILVIPGAGRAATLREHFEVLEWIRSIHAGTRYTVSVCTGSLILGAAGLLSGKKATSHWAALERLSKWGAIPVEARIVEDGKLITAAGVSAGIDMALLLTSKVAGEAAAKAIQLGIEYDPAPPFDSGSPRKAPKMVVDTLRSLMMAGFEKS